MPRGVILFIYKITNLVNGKIYIGQTTRTVEKRFYFHTKAKYQSKLKAALDKYGKENFSLETIEICNSFQELDEKEIYWIKFYNCVQNGYNIQTGGYIRDSMRGRKHSEEAKQKMSAAASGRNNSQYGKKSELSPNYKKKKTKEHVEKIAQQHRKKVLCIEKNKIYNSLKEAAIDFNVHPSNISAAIYKKNSVKRCKGFTFTYIIEETNG